MGCSQSKSAGAAAGTGQAGVSTAIGAIDVSQSGRIIRPLTDNEIAERIETTESARYFVHDGISIRYAFLSQRGYYPNDPAKENQDAFICLQDFDGGASGVSSLFGVFDGHGKDGHHCARFARDLLHKDLTEKLSALPSFPSSVSESKVSQEIKHAIELAFLSTNYQMKTQRRFDAEFSGTTAITALLRDHKIYVANVGDSRSIIVSEASDGSIFARPLSSDQTPYRQDERNRVKKYGARVLSMDQIEGIAPIHEDWGDLNLGDEIDEGGDPPRVWHARENYPGTAFTRSLGDALAETLGVVAEPEILERELCENDRFIVLASDGVFEFLTNQMVADLITASQGDALAACKSIVGEAYNMWLQYEVRTDDITIIILKIEGIAGGASRMSRASSVSKDEELPEVESKPVRRVISKEKKKNMIQTKSEEDMEGIDEHDMAVLLVLKSAEDEKAIAGAIKANFLFQNLNAQQRASVIGVMQPILVKKGEWVITQDDHGDRFYVVDSGRYEVRVRPPGKVDPTGGFVVHVYESSNGQHPGFGELSLMYGKPRAASVIALEDGKLWALDRRVFKGVVMRSMDMRKDSIRALRAVEHFKCLNLQRLQRLAEVLIEESYPAGSVLSTRGQPSDSFYLIVSGEVEITDADANVSLISGAALSPIAEGTNSTANTTTSTKSAGEATSPSDSTPSRRVLTANDYLGDSSMLQDAKAEVTAVCRAPVRARIVTREVFVDTLGELEDLQEEFVARNQRSSNPSAGPARFQDIILQAVVGADSVSTLLLGSFVRINVSSTGSALNLREIENSTPRVPEKAPAGSSSSSSNVTVRSFHLSDVEVHKLQTSLLTTLETARVIAHASVQSVFLPRMMSLYRDTNALHVLFNAPIIGDLHSIVHPPPPHETSPGEVKPPAPPATLVESDIQYVGACLVSALEALHSIGIVYRAIQPEGVHVDTSGRIVLMDYRVCKVGGVGARSFTICGATEYLAPEQISQQGHGGPVDLWALGVLLYELSFGATPFSANSEVATYSKISSFGSTSFPSLVYPDDAGVAASSSPKESMSAKSTGLKRAVSSSSFGATAPNLKSLINKLLVPAPEARLGAAKSNGFHAIQSHGFFSDTNWTTFSQAPSPLSHRCGHEAAELVDYGMKEQADLLESFGRPFKPAGQDWTAQLMHDS